MKELEDYSWFPSVLRNFQTEFIGFVVARFKVYDIFIRHLQHLSLPPQPQTDLCSGSGEPAISIFRKSNCFTQLSLSDKFPPPVGFHDSHITYNQVSTDVLDMEYHPGTCYTLFNSFHHFRDEEKLKIVYNIRDSGSSAFIAEILTPDIFCLLKVILSTTAGCLLLTPFIRPFSFRRLLLTYIIPVNILTITFDGIVSVLKSRSVKQYQTLFTNYGKSIEILRIKNGLTPLIIIQILPKK